MAEKIIMPQLGESIAEGTIVKWLKNPGDAVKKDENVVIISTDKVEAEIPAPAAGVLVDILVEPGKTVAVGTVLGHVGVAGESVAAPKVSSPKVESAKPAAPIVEQPKAALPPTLAPAPQPIFAPPPVVTPPTKSEVGFLSPLVKKIAGEQHVTEHEMRLIAGTGRDGRITKNDILQYLSNRPAPSAIAMPTMMQASAAAPLAKSPQIQIPAGQTELVQSVSTMRRVIMENMVASRRSSAHVTTFFEIDFSRVDQIRTAHKDRFRAEEGVNLTYTTFITAAVCQTLKRHPYINAEIRGDKIIFKKDIHLGIAVAITEPEPGLMVPVIRNADQMNLRGLAKSINDIAERTRKKRIKPDELSGGTFTITNPGNYGAVIGTPIINQPQVAILGVGNIKKQAVVLEMNGTDVIGIRPLGWLSLSFDHRLIDGATADMFMADLKQTLENWAATP